MSAKLPHKDTVLVIEDEPDVLDLLRLHLRRQSYNVLEASDGVTGLRMARDKLPSAVVLDLMIPEMRGEDVCRQIRATESTAKIPVIMLTAKARAEERVAGLELGADDYLTKPFSPRELVLRIQAVLRRLRSADARSDKFSVGPFELDRGSFEIRMDRIKLDLTGLEFKLLAMLMESRGRSLSRETLLRSVWGYRNVSDSRTVDTHMRRLRGKLGPHADLLETVRGKGYRFRA